jgi:signal transduction histidine kinase
VAPDSEVQADPDRLLQVLANLLSNAVKFSPRGEAVEVRASCGEDAVRVAVIDRGPGIPASFRSHIFQKFAQADASDSKAKGGTGLGLSIAKAIIEQLGGRIGFESEVGQGATFWLELPAAALH